MRTVIAASRPTRHGTRLALWVVAGLLCAVVVWIGPTAPTTITSAAPSTGFTGLTPARLLDTRTGAVTIDNQQQATGAFGPTETRDLPILGRGGVPLTGVGAIAINITAINPTDNSFITIHPTGTPRPNASNLNLAPGRTLPNMAIVPIGTGGNITIYNDNGNTDLAIDILGWFPTTPPGEGFAGLTPARLLDTRTGAVTIDNQQQATGAFGPTETRDLPILGRGGVPLTGVGAIAINITAINPTDNSFITIHPTGTPRPNASNLNLAPGRTLPNMAIVPIGTGGNITIYNDNDNGNTDLAIDILGWFPTTPPGEGFAGLTPARLLDTRTGAVTIDNQQQATGAFGPTETRDLPILGRGGVPLTGVGAIAINITAINPTDNSFITIHPTGTPRPNASNLNLAPGRTLPNMAIVPIGTGGNITIYNDNDNGNTDLAIDILGWFPALTTAPTTTTTTTPPTTTPPTTTPPILASTVAVSKALNNRSHGGISFDPIISRNGNKVAFSSLASNLVAGDTNNVADVFITDLTTNVTERVSVGDDESQLALESQDAAISDDGRYVVFTTATAVVAADTNNDNDVYRRDLQTGTTTLVSLRDNETQFPNAHEAEVSGDGNIVVFLSENPGTVVIAATNPDVWVRDVIAGTTVLASMTVSGFENGAGSTASISQNGSKVVLVKIFPGSPARKIFRYDRTFNTIGEISPAGPAASTGGAFPEVSDDGAAVVYQRGDRLFMFEVGHPEQAIDVSTAGAVSNGQSRHARFAGSGHDVIFESAGNNLTVDDANGKTDIFMRTTGVNPTTSLLSFKVKASFVTPSNGVALFPSMSSDGSKLIMVSNATNLAANADNGVSNVMLREGGGASYRIIDLAGFTVVAHGASDHPSMSPDGRFVVFDSAAADLVNNDFGGRSDAYLLDRSTQQITMVGLKTGTNPLDFGSFSPDVSDDGNRVVFIAPPPLGAGVDGIQQAFVRDRTTAVTSPISVSAGGFFSSLPVNELHISGNGRFVVFSALAPNLVPGDSNARIDVFVRDLQANTIERVSLSSTGTEATGSVAGTLTASPSISADGRFVTFVSSATNLVPGATTAIRRVYVRDRQLATTTLVSVGESVAISDDGTTVAFRVFSSLAGDDTNGGDDVYVKVLAGGAPVRVSVKTGGAQAAAGSGSPFLSADGRYVSFLSSASDLVGGDTNGFVDAFIHDRQTGVTARISASNTGQQSNGTTFAPGAPVSNDGRFLAFVSDASNLITGDFNETFDIFLRDRGVA